MESSSTMRLDLDGGQAIRDTSIPNSGPVSPHPAFKEPDIASIINSNDKRSLEEKLMEKSQVASRNAYKLRHEPRTLWPVKGLNPIQKKYAAQNPDVLPEGSYRSTQGDVPSTDFGVPPLSPVKMRRRHQLDQSTLDITSARMANTPQSMGKFFFEDDKDVVLCRDRTVKKNVGQWLTHKSDMSNRKYVRLSQQLSRISCEPKFQPELVYDCHLARPILPICTGMLLTEEMEETINITVNGAQPEGCMPSQRVPLSVTILFEMTQDLTVRKVKESKEGIVAFIRKMKPGDVFTLIGWTSSQRDVRSFVLEKDTTEARIMDWLSNLHLLGNVSKPLEVLKLAGHEARRHAHPNVKSTLIYITDTFHAFESDVCDFATSLAESGISISTVGMGPVFNEDIQLSLSFEGLGNYYWKSPCAPEDLYDMLQREATYLNTIRIRDLRVYVTLNDGFRYLGAQGYPERRVADTNEILLGDLAKNQTHDILVTYDYVGINTRPDQKVEIGEITFLFEDTFGSSKTTTMPLTMTMLTLNEYKVKSKDPDKRHVVKQWRCEAAMCLEECAKPVQHLVKTRQEINTDKLRDLAMKCQQQADQGLSFAMEVKNLAGAAEGMQVNSRHVRKVYLSKARELLRS